MSITILEPDFFVDFAGRIHTGALAVQGRKIIAVTSNPDELPGKKLRLKNQVILPGFVNAHSHAFQRAMRGLAERKSIKDDFFSWRDQMYHLVNNLSLDDFSVVSQLAYLEMIEAGFTHVGEFHYVHHDVGGKPFNDPLAMSRAVSKAAATAGINLCLLECAYQRHNFLEPAKPQQQRFLHHEVNEFLAMVKQAHRELVSDSIAVGLAIHSVRAVPESWFSAIADFVRTQKMPLHIHASEQQQDVTNCLKHTELSPIGLLDRYHLLTPKTTLIHASHLIGDDKELINENRPIICVCPSTEKNLGDGMLWLNELDLSQVKICLGTDQHVRMDPFCEARSLEEQERLRLFRRGILTNINSFLYQALLPCLTTSGMLSLIPSHDSSSLVGQDANLVAILLPPEYQWHGPSVALDAIMLAHHPSKITQVMVNGSFALENGHLACQEKPYLIKEIRTFFKKLNSI